MAAAGGLLGLTISLASLSFLVTKPAVWARISEVPSRPAHYLALLSGVDKLPIPPFRTRPKVGGDHDPVAHNPSVVAEDHSLADDRIVKQSAAGHFPRLFDRFLTPR